MLGTSFVLALTSAALASAQLTPNNLVTPSVSGELSGLKYTSVGATGSYWQVTNMQPGTWPSCTIPQAQACQKSLKQVTGALAPFNEQMSFVFRGPMQISNIAVYQPTNTTGATWKRVSSWAANQAPENMVFMNNQGGGASGEWSGVC